MRIHAADYTRALLMARRWAVTKLRYDPVDDDESWDRLANQISHYLDVPADDVVRVIASVRVSAAPVFQLSPARVPA